MQKINPKYLVRFEFNLAFPPNVEHAKADLVFFALGAVIEHV